MMEEQANSEEEFLANYRVSDYERPSVTVDILLFGMHQGQPETDCNFLSLSLQILLIKRKNHPFQNHWALPGGFVEMDEDLRTAAARELYEETHLSPSYLEQLYTWGDVGRDPRSRVISTSYLGVVNQEAKDLLAGDDAMEAKWFDLTLTMEQVETKESDLRLEYSWVVVLSLESLGEAPIGAKVQIRRTIEGATVSITRNVLENNGLAFDHCKIIEYGVEMLRHKIKYTDLAFLFLPRDFTLSNLQQVYEAILDKKLLGADFRRNIADKLIETERYVNGEQLFTFNDHWLDQPLQEGVIDLWS